MKNEEAGAGVLRLTLYVAGRPNDSIPLEFTRLLVQGKPVSPIPQSSTPHTVSVDLGKLAQGTQLTLEWTFHTHIITQPTEVAIGVIRMPGSGRTLLEKLVIGHFQDYSGTGTVTV